MSHAVEDFRPFDRSSLCLDFTSRMQDLVSKHDVSILAWALMPNHFHLLVETGRSPLHVFMHDLLTGFCVRVNRVHDRRGHVFMSRFRSILVERESYLLRLIRYIHLNPVKGRTDVDLMDLEPFRWTGHPAILGQVDVPWQDSEMILSMFSRGNRQEAVRDYVSFIREGLGLEEEPGLEEGLFMVGRSGVVPIGEISSDQRRYDFVGSVLGSRDFAASIIPRLDGCRRGGVRKRGREHVAIERLLSEICHASGIRRWTLGSRNRGSCAVRARMIACLVLSRCGLSKADIGRLLGLTRQGVGWLITSYQQKADVALEEEITYYQDIFNGYIQQSNIN